MSILADLKESGTSKEEMEKALSNLPDVSGIVTVWDGDIDFSRLRGFEYAFSEGNSSLWFLRLRGGNSHEIIDLYEPEEDPTTDRLFLANEDMTKALNHCAAACQLLAPLLNRDGRTIQETEPK